MKDDKLFSVLRWLYIALITIVYGAGLVGSFALIKMVWQAFHK